MGTASVSNCNWAGCYDDVHFFRTVLTSMQGELCVDPARTYATGVSNGAMLLYTLAHRMPTGTFAGLVAWYGLLLRGMANRSTVPAGVPLLHLHGLEDETIPAVGDYAGGYYYHTLNDTLGDWASANRCDVRAGPVQPVRTPWDGPRWMQHRCAGFQSCPAHGQSVQRCFFPGEKHGFWPEFGEAMTWWFLTGEGPTAAEVEAEATRRTGVQTEATVEAYV